MAQSKHRVVQQTPRVEEVALPVLIAPAEGEILYIRFAFGVWLVVFSILATSILWDSIYGLIYRHPPV
jgi:hypothetical protein